MSAATLSPAVTAAITRAAQRLHDAGVGIVGPDGVDVDYATSVITDELAPVLAALALPAQAATPTFITLPLRQGCIGTRYCHACKVSYGGTCLCVPNKCHACGAECGTTPPAEDTTYEHRMHY